MKRLPMIIIMLAAALSFLFAGTNFLVANATSPIKHASPNHYLFNDDPRMITADADNVFVLDGLELVALNNEGDLKPATIDLTDLRDSVNVPASITAPLHIKHAGSFLFVFEQDKVSTFTFNNTTRTFAQGRFRADYRTSASPNFSFFDVTFTSGVINPYRVYFATTSQYGWSDFATTPNTPQNSSGLHSFSNINNIVASARTSLLVHVSSGGFHHIHKFDLATATSAPTPHPSERVNRPNLSPFTSLAIIPSTDLAVFIYPREGLTLLDMDSGELFPHTNNPVSDPAFPTGKSRAPFRVTAFDKDGVYVIDMEKSSIDRYEVTDDLELEFASVIAGYRGGDRGFFNNPSSLTLINSAVRKGNDTQSSEYLITDESGQIMYNRIDRDGKVTSRHFFADPDQRLSPEARATYDNFDTVYIYDLDGGHRVRTFTFDGKPTNQEPFTGFGRVNKLFADNARNVYAITDTAIYKMGKNDPVRPLTIDPNRNGVVYSEHLNAIIIANGSTTVQILSLGTDTNPSPPDPSPLVLSHGVIDVAIDIDGNLVTLSEEGGLFYASVYKLDISTGEFATTRPAPTLLLGASNTTIVNPNTSFTLDRMNGRILLIGEHHAVEAFKFGEPLSYTHNDAWKDNTQALRKDAPIFLEAKADTVIYQYPNGTRARALAETPAIFKVLDIETHYVLYENSTTGEFITGYVSFSPEIVTPDGFFYVTPTMTPPPPHQPMTFIEARIIFDNTAVYKYPTADRRLFPDPSPPAPRNPGLQLFTLPMNFGQGVSGRNGLLLRARVVATDVREFVFYEILLGFDGTKFFPDDQGDYVGYVRKLNVINFNLPPSNERFSPNATIRISQSSPYFATGVRVYERTSTGQFIPVPDAFLANRRAIHATGPSIQGYTQISYHDPDLGDDGHTFKNFWVQSEYVVMNGLSALQLVAITSLTLLVLGGITFTIILVRKKRS